MFAYQYLSIPAMNHYEEISHQQIDVSKYPLIIGLTGTKNSGKDTIGNYLANKYAFTKICFAEPLKKSCQVIFGFTNYQLNDVTAKEKIDPYWKYSPREILQKVGTELFRDKLGQMFELIGDDIWVKILHRKITDMINDGVDRIVITDVRFPNEANYIKKQDGYIWKVTCSNVSPNKYSLHKSETNQSIIPDENINNDSTIKNLFSIIDKKMKYFI
jgi:hypothetical protein